MIAPWLAPLDTECRESIKGKVAAAPPLSDRQRRRLQLLFRAGRGTA